VTDPFRVELAGGGERVVLDAVGMGVRQGMRQAPELTVSAEDPGGVLLDSEVLAADEVTADVDGRRWRLRGVGRRNGSELTLTMWDEVAALLDDATGGDLAVQGTLADFARRLAGDAGVGVEVVGQPASEASTFERRSDESSWQALGQMVDDRDGWERYVSGGRLVVADRDELAADVAAELDERDASVSPVELDLRPGGLADEASVSVTVAGGGLAGGWEPARAVDVARPRPAEGRWLVETVRRRSLSSALVDLSLVRP